jgi:hypothetical protein
MLVGHIAVGLAAKRIEPGVSLGTLVLAALLADILWGLFLLAGLEQVAFTSGRGAANYYIATNVAWSHSLATNLVWAALFASAWRIRHSARGGWILAAAVLSHWCWMSSATAPTCRSRLALTYAWVWACGPPSPLRS